VKENYSEGGGRGSRDPCAFPTPSRIQNLRTGGSDFLLFAGEMTSAEVRGERRVGGRTDIRGNVLTGLTQGKGELRSAIKPLVRRTKGLRRFCFTTREPGSVPL